MTKNKSTYGPLLIDEVKESEILITAYGFLMTAIQTNMGWCCVCREFLLRAPGQHVD